MHKSSDWQEHSIIRHTHGRYEISSFLLELNSENPVQDVPGSSTTTSDNKIRMSALWLINLNQSSVVREIKRLVNIKGCDIASIPGVLFKVQIENVSSYKCKSSVFNGQSYCRASLSWVCIIVLFISVIKGFGVWIKRFSTFRNLSSSQYSIFSSTHLLWFWKHTFLIIILCTFSHSRSFFLLTCIYFILLSWLYLSLFFLWYSFSYSPHTFIIWINKLFNIFEFLFVCHLRLVFWLFE